MVGTLSSVLPAWASESHHGRPQGWQAPCGEWGLGLGLHPLFPSPHLSSLSQSRARRTPADPVAALLLRWGQGGWGGQAFSVAESFRTPFQSRTLSQHLGRCRGSALGLPEGALAWAGVQRIPLWGGGGGTGGGGSVVGLGWSRVSVGDWELEASIQPGTESRVKAGPPLLSAQGGVGRPFHVQGALSG